MRLNVVIAFSLSLLGTVPSFAADVVVEDAWIREAPPSAPVRAGYLTVSNAGTVPVSIRGAGSDAFGAIEIHEMADTGDGTMRMRRIESIEVPAGGRVELKPGGMHLMLFRPQQSLAVGDRVDAKLLLDSGESIAFRLEQR